MVSAAAKNASARDNVWALLEDEDLMRGVTLPADCSNGESKHVALRITPLHKAMGERRVWRPRVLRFGARDVLNGPTRLERMIEPAMRNAAACIVQSHARKASARHSLRTRRRAAVVVQSHARANTARTACAAKRCNAAATRMQAHMRAVRARGLCGRLSTERQLDAHAKRARAIAAGTLQAHARRRVATRRRAAQLFCDREAALAMDMRDQRTAAATRLQNLARAHRACRMRAKLANERESAIRFTASVLHAACHPSRAAGVDRSGGGVGSSSSGGGSSVPDMTRRPRKGIDASLAALIPPLDLGSPRERLLLTAGSITKVAKQSSGAMGRADLSPLMSPIPSDRLGFHNAVDCDALPNEPAEVQLPPPQQRRRKAKLRRKMRGSVLAAAKLLNAALELAQPLASREPGDELEAVGVVPTVPAEDVAPVEDAVMDAVEQIDARSTAAEHELRHELGTSGGTTLHDAPVASPTPNDRVPADSPAGSEPAEPADPKEAPALKLPADISKTTTALPPAHRPQSAVMPRPRSGTLSKRETGAGWMRTAIAKARSEDKLGPTSAMPRSMSAAEVQRMQRLEQVATAAAAATAPRLRGAATAIRRPASAAPTMLPRTNPPAPAPPAPPVQSAPPALLATAAPFAPPAMSMPSVPSLLPGPSSRPTNNLTPTLPPAPAPARPLPATPMKPAAVAAPSMRSSGGGVPQSSSASTLPTRAASTLRPASAGGSAVGWLTGGHPRALRSPPFFSLDAVLLRRTSEPVPLEVPSDVSFAPMIKSDAHGEQACLDRARARVRELEIRQNDTPPRTKQSGYATNEPRVSEPGIDGQVVEVANRSSGAPLANTGGPVDLALAISYLETNGFSIAGSTSPHDVRSSSR